MKVGFIGLGRMGYSMSERLIKNRFKVVVYNRSAGKVKSIVKKGAIGSISVQDFVQKLGKKKIIWLMLPAGKITDDMIVKLLPLLSPGDIIVNGANEFYGNAKKNYDLCKKHGVYFFDCGVSGGIHGLEKGYVLMFGGDKKKFKEIEPICKSLAPKKGYGYFGESGSGHFVKSVHNIIEYVYFQGIAEGIELLSKFDKKIDLKKAVDVWGSESVIKSWLIDLTSKALKRNDFSKIGPKISSVTIDELNKTKKAVKGYSPAFDAATKVRRDKSKKFSLGKRVISAVRREMGGHSVKKK